MSNVPSSRTKKEENQMLVDPHKGSIAPMHRTGEAAAKRCSWFLPEKMRC